MFSKPIIKKLWSTDASDFVQKLKRIREIELDECSSVILKVQPEFIEILSNSDPDRAQAIARIKEKPLFLLTLSDHNFEHMVYRVEKDSVPRVTADADALTSIRNEDLKQVLARSGDDAILVAPSGTHYVTPSNKHTERFIRFSDMMRSYGAIDRVSYWLAPFIDDNTYVVADHWDLSSVILQAQLIRKSKPVRFSSFNHSVSRNRLEVEQLFYRIRDENQLGTKILFLVGVSSSGQFFSDLSAMVQDHPLRDDDVSYLSVYKFANTPDSVNALGELDLDISWYPADACELCNSGKNVRKQIIDDHFHYPRPNPPNLVTMPKKYFVQGKNDDVDTHLKNFIKEAGLIPEALCVHRDDPNDGRNPRHHAYYVDISVLLESAGFRRSFKDYLLNILENDVPDLIVIPPHQAGDKLAEIAEECWSGKIIRSHNLEDASFQNNQEIKNLLILDDVVISGRRLDTYNRFLRESNQFSKIERIFFVVLLARPESEEKWDNLKQAITVGHHWQSQLCSFRTLYLPNYGFGDCPWCREWRVLSNLEIPFSPPLYFSDRLVVLGDTTTGITSNPFFLLPETKPAVLGDGSPLAEPGSSEIQTLFSVCAGLQQMRFDQNDKHSLRRLYNLSGSLDPENNLTRYSEPVIVTSLLKAAEFGDWPDHAPQVFAEKINSTIDDTTFRHLLGEALLFFQVNNMNVDLNESVVKVLEAYISTEPSSIDPINQLVSAVSAELINT